MNKTTTKKRTDNPPILNKVQARALAAYLAQEGQLLLPMLSLIEQSRLAVDEVIDVVGRATIEAVLQMSAAEIAGPKQQGKKSQRDIAWHGNQDGVVALSDRMLRVERPRLRRKGIGLDGEVEIPAYEAMQKGGRLGERMMEILMAGVSTRKYETVIGRMADTVGVKKSSVSRKFVEESAQALEKLMARRFEDLEVLIVYIDGMVFAGTHVLAAVGVDAAGDKTVLGLREGASENETVATALLEDLVERGLSADRKRLFVIDGSKALRKAIDKVYGSRNPVQRCRQHKVKNVVGYLPEELKQQTKSVMRAAYKLDAEKGIAKLRQHARWLETQYPSASSSLREGLDETFTINRLGLSRSLRRCLATTNLIESPNSSVRRRTGRVTRWRNATMVLRWAAASFVDAERNFRKIMGYRDLWMLQAALDEDDIQLDRKKEAA